MPGTARVSSAAAAIVWLVGLPMVGLAGVIPSDAEYFTMGIVAAALGLVTAPLVVAYAHPALRSLSPIVPVIGLTGCAGLLMIGALLMAGSTGLLGERAPTWVLPAAELAARGVLSLGPTRDLVHPQFETSGSLGFRARCACGGVIPGRGTFPPA